MVTPVDIPVAIDVLAVLVGTIFGALHAIRSRFDIVGVIGLGIVGGLGGGIARDLLLNQVPVALNSSLMLPLSVGASFLIFVLRPPNGRRLSGMLDLFDALMLGLFAVVGVAKALALGANIPGAIFVGVVASVAGGVTCDLLSGSKPAIFHSGPLYAIVAAIGSCTFVGLTLLGVDQAICVMVAAFTASVIRLAAIRFNVSVPDPKGVIPVIIDRGEADENKI